MNRRGTTLLVWALHISAVLHLSADEAAPHPAWATAAGRDDIGPWSDAVCSGITQRFLLIAPGHFILGSSAAERQAAVDGAHIKAEWIASEIAHPVTITTSYWLADSSCTQALWQAVMGHNPSNFTGDIQRPVEQVSYDDCQTFIAKLNTALPNAAFRLPTEAE